MKIPPAKLKAILLYFCNYTDTKFLGKTKLMKLFYFLDFMHLKQYGSPVTFDTYVKMEHGPIPAIIKLYVDTACENIDESFLFDTIYCERIKTIDIRMYKILPVRKFAEKDKKLFSVTELEILEKICARYGNKNTAYIEEASHKEAAYQKTCIGQTIPYTIATEDEDCLVEKENIELLMKIYS
ncbi:MAG TPA: Panacea domain-containing protein [Patescibacteria group bacterium]|nr:Panacea domain-containing protein [Patescibacteria group bacterium]